MTQKKHRVVISLLLLFTLFECKQRSQISKDNVICPNLSPTESILFFERGFNKTHLVIKVDGDVYFDDSITTDRALDLAKEILIKPKTSESVTIKINEEKEVSFCLNHFMRFNLLDTELKIEALSSVPNYYE